MNFMAGDPRVTSGIFVVVYSLLLILNAQAVFALGVTDETLLVEDARLLEPLPGQTTAVVYLRVKNMGSDAVDLLGGIMANARAIELHEHRHEDGMMRMRRVPQVHLSANSERAFVPGGLHIMVFGYRSLGANYPVAIELLFSDQRRLQVPLRLERF